MGNPSEVSPGSIAAIRERDPKSQNEAAPETQTLNERRVLEFLHGKVVLENFDELFNLDMAIQLTAAGKTPTEKMINGKLLDARTILEKYGQGGLKNETDLGVLSAALENLKTPPANMRAEEAPRVLHAFEFFKTIKFEAKRLLNAEDVLSTARKAEYVQSKGIMDGVKEKLGDARENWDKLSTGQKMAMAGMALLGGIWLFKSENKIIQKIKDTLMTGVKVAGGAWLLDKAWYLFSGETLWDFASGSTKPSQRKATFLKEAYRTDDKGAELMSKSFVLLGELSFMDLLNQYENNPKNNKGSNIEGTRMAPADAYQAMHIFVSRFGLERLKNEYAKYRPPICFSQVAVIEMSKDPNIKMEESLTSRVGDTISDSFKKGYYYLASSGPGIWLADKYKSWFGKEATPEELQNFAKRFGEIVQKDSEVDQAIQDRLLRNERQIAKHYVDTNKAGIAMPRFGLKYKRQSDGYLYIIVDKVMHNVNGDEKALNATVQSCVSQAEDFLVEQFKVKREDASRKCQPHGSVFVSDTATLKYLVRYKEK